MIGPTNFVATGHALPETIVLNEEIESRCQLEPGWIEKRTGIMQRPIVSPEQSVSNLAIDSGRQAIKRAFPEPGSRRSIGMLILATSTPDYLLPPTAPFVANQLGLGTIPAFDIAVACSGFLYAIQLADHHCRSTGQAVLVIAANVLSKRIAQSDPSTAAIFADGAGAVIVAPGKEPGILATQLESDGSDPSALQIPEGGSKNAFNEKTFAQKGHLMKVNNGMAVFRYAVESMTRLGQKVLGEAGKKIGEVDFWIPHQANLRIIESVRERLGIPSHKTGVTIDRFANSSAATIPIALDYFISLGKIQKGELILMTAAAAGLTSGACLIRL